MVDDFVNCPKAYCLDVGVLSSGETALIEVTDTFSVSMYGMGSKLYGELLHDGRNLCQRLQIIKMNEMSTLHTFYKCGYNNGAKRVCILRFEK